MVQLSKRIIAVHQFPHFILMQPNWVSIYPYKLIRIHPINSNRSLDSYLFAIHEYPHENFLTLFFSLFSRTFLSFCKFLFYLGHDLTP
ncbi:hypothetical protein CCP4SC76_5300013 [Gammaproteobacteria bacterium]